MKISISDEMKRRINEVIKLTPQETIKTMFVRVCGDGEDEWMDVAPEMATCLVRKRLARWCDNCGVFHTRPGVPWKLVTEQLQQLMN